MEMKTSPRPASARYQPYRRILVLLMISSLLLGMSQLSSAVAAVGGQAASPAKPAAGNKPQDCTPQVGVPTLTSPTNGSNTNADNAPPLGIPQMTWTTPSGQLNYYEIQVSHDPSFPNSSTYDRTTFSTNHTPVTDANYGSYFPNGSPTYWRVRAYDSANCAANWSTVFNFVRNWNNSPTLLSPTNGQSLTYLEHPSFSWTPTAGADNYLLRISTDPSCLASVYRQFTTSETEYNIAERLPTATYYWCVAPLDFGNGAGHLSAVFSFILNSLAAPNLLSPTSGAILTYTQQLSWTAVKGAARYHLEYSPNSDFTGATQIDTAYTSYTPATMLGNESNWYWRVAAVDPNGQRSQFATSTFRIVWSIQPQLLTPNNLYYHVTYPYFQWTGVPDAREYRLQIATDSHFPQNQIVVDVRTSATSYIIGPPTFVPDGVTTYYWRVQALGTDPNLNQGGISNVFSFKYNTDSGASYSSAVPTLFYPPYAYNSHPDFDRPITSSVQVPVFQWQRVTSATNYIVTFGSTINMTDTLLQANTTQPNFSPWMSDNSGNGFTFDPNRIYYWQVQYQVNGVTGPVASQVWAVRVNTGLDVVYPYSNTGWLQSPNDLQDYVNMDPVFRWYPYPNANKYTLQVATDSAFNNIVQTATTAYAATALRQQLPRELYYWRVLAYNGNTLLSTSSANRLHIFAPAIYNSGTNIRTISGTLVASGTVGSGPYDLSAVYATKTDSPISAYKFALAISSQTGTAVNYSIPINLDYSLVDINGQPTTPSGAPNDPLFTNIHYSGEFQAEYVIKFTHNANGTWTTPMMYAWNQQGNGGSYDASVINLISAGGAFTPTSGYVELSVPTGSVLTYRGNADLNVSTGDPTLVGLEPYTTDASGNIQDTVPDDPTALGSSHTLSEFRSLSDHPNPAFPFNTDFGGNGQGIPYNLSVLFSSNLAWYMPEPTDLHGFDVETAIDRGFTSEDTPYSIRIANGQSAFQYMFGGIAGGLNGGRVFLPTYAANTYFWRVRVCRDNGIPCGVIGSWSKPNRFNKVDIKVDSPTVTVNYGIPTFSWPRTEGAYQYEVNVHTNVQYTNQYDDSGGVQNTSYTPIIDYKEQDYYYRLRASEYYYNAIDQAPWTQVTQPFHVTIPVPQNLRITDTSPVTHSPTYVWDDVLVPSGTPILQAFQYELQTSVDVNFTQLKEDVTTVAPSWSTANTSYPGGTYFFRVRTLLLNNAADSNWTTPITYTKQYPIVNTNDGNAVRSGNCSITFSWPAFNTTGNPTEKSGIFGYRLETADNPNFSNERIFDTNNASFTNFNDVGGCTFSPYTTTYWRVSMLDSYLNQGPADVHTIVGQPTPTVTGTPPTATPTWTPGGPSATPTPTNTPSGPTNTPTITPTPFSQTNTPTPSITPGGPTATACAIPFVDVPPSYWAYGFITYVYCHGVVSGIDGTHFSPNTTATRGQFSRMVVKARGLTIITPSTPYFTDVPVSYFAYQYIETARLAGIVGGYTAAQCQAAHAQFPCFLPNNPVSRGAMAKFVVKAWGWSQTTPSGGQTFTDVPPSYPFYIFIETAHGLGIIDGETQAQCQAAHATYPCYLPNNNLLRAELSKTLKRSMTAP